MEREEFFIQQKRECESCGGTGKVYSDAWGEIRETLRKALEQIERTDPYPKKAFEYFAAANNEMRTVLDAPVRVDCPSCGGKGAIFAPVELTPEIVAALSPKTQPAKTK